MGDSKISLGANAGQSGQGANTVALGINAGNTNQGASARGNWKFCRK